VIAPEVVIEKLIQDGFADLVTNATTQIPVIFSQFSADYISETIGYLTSPNFKTNTIFSYYFDPAVLPAFNIVLASEFEGPGDRQMYLNDIVEAAANIPNTEPYQSQGSDWACSITVIIRAEKARQTIILYSLVKWILLKNRMVLEAAGMKANKFSGSDLAFTPNGATFIFNRQMKIETRIYNTFDVPVLPPAPGSEVINSVVSKWPTEVRTLEDEDEVLGGNHDF
jgi:hypothetical protein